MFLYIKKSERIKAYWTDTSAVRRRSMVVMTVCFNTHIGNSVLTIWGQQRATGVPCKNAVQIGSIPTASTKLWLGSSVWQNVGLQNQMSEVQILPGSPNMEQLMLWRVHRRTVNPSPCGKHSWFDSKLLHQIPVLLPLKQRLISDRDPVAEDRQRSNPKSDRQNLTAHRL